MNIKILYDQGTETRTEDFLVFFPNKVVGVIDTASPVFIPPEQPKMFYGMTGGQLIGSKIINAIGHDLSGYVTPTKILKWVNLEVKEALEENDLSIETPENNPFASYALAFFDGIFIQIIQGGDCQFVYQGKDGSVGWTENQTLEYDRENLRLIAEFMRKHCGDRPKMWREFGPILKMRRREHLNSEKGKFSVLNGQPDFEKYWRRLILSTLELKTLICFTDGFVIQEETADMVSLTPRILHQYYHGGLQEVLNTTRKSASSKASESHVTWPEAMAIAIEF